MGLAAFTIATGKPVYLEMAFGLARSFRLWHRREDIHFVLATDRDRSSLPSDLVDLDLIPLQPGQYGSGFTPKLYLDRIAPAEKSLFIDADCLCVGSLASAFQQFSGHAVSVVGREVADGEWFGDVATICGQFGIGGMPKFNGGVYYLERGAACSRVYETARSLLSRYDEIGFGRLRGQPNDEVVISLAMALCGETSIPERGDIMNSLLAGPAGLEIDVFKGRALLRNPRRHPRYNPWYELEEMRPRLVHFLGADINSHPYGRESTRLRLVYQKHWPRWLARMWTNLWLTLPSLITSALKNFLRPLYHAILGPRRIKRSVRV